MNWIIENWVEIFGAFTGLLYIFLSIKQNILLWVTGLISCSVYTYVFFVSKFYADIPLQLYYIVISIYGWYLWTKNKGKEGENIKTAKTPKKLILPLIIITAIFFILISFILKSFTDSPVPYGDALTTSFGITATWMLAKKYIEHWLIWIITDLVAVSLYFYKDMYPTVILYFIYTIMAILGYYQWKKLIQNAENQ